MKKYQIVYADPPWDYGSFPSRSDLKSEAHVYPLMPTARICALPVRRIVHDNALLFLWTTMTHIPDALDVIEAWGFRYVTNGFTWVKTNPKSGGFFLGMGYWTRRDRRVSSLVIAPRRAHSRKPDIVRDLIVRICGDVPRIELFARTRTPGWDVWGNELANDCDLETLARGRHSGAGRHHP